MNDAANSSPHPSSLALDRHALGVAGPEVAAHVASCERCRARLTGSAPAPDAPAWARQLPPRRRGWLLWPVRSRPRALGLTVAAVACAALVWVTGRSLVTPETPHDYVGTKGGPELWLYVKRGETVALWNGTDPVIPGDLLRLKIQPDRFKHVTIFGAAKAAGEQIRLYDSAISSGQPTALPFSLKVDAQPGDETLLVVLDDGEKRGSRWSRRLVLAKTVNPHDGSPP